MSFWRSAQPLILASKSASRQAVLKAAGIPIEIRPADLDERTLERDAPASTPHAVALWLAAAKARAISAAAPDRLVLGADQTLAVHNRRFDKPENRAAAHQQLQALAGMTHALHSAIAFARDGEILYETIATAHLTMRPLSDAFIAEYLDAIGSVATSTVGAYQLEGLGIHLFAAIDGDHSTILGMPLVPVLEFLRDQNMLAR